MVKITKDGRTVEVSDKAARVMRWYGWRPARRTRRRETE